MSALVDSSFSYEHSMPGMLALAAGIAAVAFLLTGRVLKYARARDILDHPNARSSHAVPTPRGGGIAIVSSAIAALVVGACLHWESISVCLALGLGGALTAWIGWKDDKHHVAPRWRALVHGVAALIAVIALGGFPTLRLGPVTLHVGIFGSLIGIVGIVGAINFYNFMDGIDGIASVEGWLVGLFGALLSAMFGGASLVFPSLVISAACLGFLPWNWSPAKIFMGDVGSGFLGYWFAVLAIASENIGALPALAWALLLGVFVFDATVTLSLRAKRGERLSHAHQSHAYQRAVQRGFTHRQVTAFVGVLTAAFAGLIWWSDDDGTTLAAVVALATLVMAVAYVVVTRPRAPASARTA